jgi:hypothetical protein
MPVNRYYSSTAQPTTLSGSISSGATSISVGATTGFPSTTPFTLALDYGAATEELVDVTGVAGTTLTVTRGADGTSAQSHSLGAAVRHVASARDFADFQTHQATGSAVHGVSGTLVGTSDSQTLSNKTLSSPSIAGGALSGTFTGTPTFSGAVTFSAASLFNNGFQVSNAGALFTRAASASAAVRATVSGDTNDRMAITAGGDHQWGPGNASADVSLGRITTGRLQLLTGQWSTAAGTRTIEFATNPTDLKNSTFVNGESVDRWQLLANGQMAWGGGSGTTDVTLFRNAAGVLRTNGALIIDGNLTFNGPSWSTWTPTWGTTSGSNIPSFGNATVAGRYIVMGKTVIFTLSIAFGSSTNFGGGGLTDNWTFSIPGGQTFNSALTTNTNILLATGRGTQSASNTCPIIVRANNSTSFIIDTAGGKQDGNALTNAGTIDALTPWTWANGDVIHIQGSYEIA